MQLLFIRHAQSVGNLEQRMQGHSADELSPEGEQQARHLRQHLLSEGWMPTKIYSSPLQRAAQTTSILMEIVSHTVSAQGFIQPDPAMSANIPVEYAEELQEFQNGVFQGLTWAEAAKQYPELCQALESSPEWIPIPGAESLTAGRDRARRFIHRLLQHHQNEDAIWIVTHHWILQHLLAELLGCDRTWNFAAGYTALFEFWIDLSRWHRGDQNRYNSELWQIRRFNDCSHFGTTPSSPKPR
jgi:2,3-bisphosphoglycerate-dependent phosphoglycerate mutase